VRELLKAGLLNGEAQGVMGPISGYTREPVLENGGVSWREAPHESRDSDVLRPASDPFQAEGGLRLVEGPMGRGVVKVSAVKPEHHTIEAPARVFDSQEALKAAFKAGELDRDVVAVVRFQGPAANGMPELHSISPSLGVLQDRGFKVALVTDGRMSGASGKVPAAIHVGPEAAKGGPIAKVRDGDVVRVDAATGRLELKVDPAEFDARDPAPYRPNQDSFGLGRELFSGFRLAASDAETGGSLFNHLEVVR
ncbi:MAG: dihydroxy-acid dehydratase, partial [Pseudomonadota bacterium]